MDDCDCANAFEVMGILLSTVGSGVNGSDFVCESARARGFCVNDGDFGSGAVLSVLRVNQKVLLSRCTTNDDRVVLAQV